ncbi:MAG TPA: MFS transporter [Rectinemataceae bacterium]|nr:MFS transporter [Rectinemataceae bacterium]
MEGIGTGYDGAMAGEGAPRPRRFASLGTLGVLSTGHLLNDLYSNFLPQLLPFLLVLMPGFTATQAAILVASFNISSSLFQPIFGFAVDGKGHTWLIYVGTLWMAVFLSLTGLVHSYVLMVALAAMAGLGTSAFHPPASAMVHGLSARYKAVYQSAFVAFGNFGFALAPLALVPLFQAFGLGASTLLIIPGALAAAILFFALPRQTRRREGAVTLRAAWVTIRKSARELAAIMAVISVRSAAYTGLLALLPLYFHSRGVSNIDASRMLTLMLFTGAFGGIAGGFISDRWGRKILIVGSLVLATPLFFGFLATAGTASLVFLALAGAALLASFSVTTVAAQEAIPEHKAMAAGLSLGFANGLGALAVIFIGRVGDLWGLPQAVALLVSLPLAAGLLGLFLRHHPGQAAPKRP